MSKIKKFQISIIFAIILIIAIFLVISYEKHKDEEQFGTEAGIITSLEETEGLDRENNETEQYLQTTEAIQERERQKLLNKTDQADIIGAESISQYDKYRILPSVIVAKAMYESGFGVDEVAATANNYFNLEYVDGCGTDYKIFKFGESSDLKDDDTRNDEYTVAYRKYDTPSDCVMDYENYISKKNPKIIGETDFVKACQIIDKSHSDELIKLIEQYQYDKNYDSMIEIQVKGE